MQELASVDIEDTCTLLQDAHEFLAQCLDQLKEDCMAIVPVSV